MAEDLTSADVLSKLALTASDDTAKEFNVSGIVPSSMTNVDIKKTATIMGITPEQFSKEYSTIEFDFKTLMETFDKYCKDFSHELEDNKPSKALEFSAKILFEYGPYIRQEKKGKGDKAIRFKFPYVKDTKKLVIKVVIVSTFKETYYKDMVQDNKMIMTFKQAAMLAMITFNRAVKHVYSKLSQVLLTPLCGATFSRENIKDMAREIGVEEVKVIQIINASTTNGGQYLEESNMACAIVAVISATKKVSNKDLRFSMITKTIKQYAAKHKIYNSNEFNIFAKYALGGVPPGLDAETLIQNFSNIQVQEVNMRVAAKASMETRMLPRIVSPADSGEASGCCVDSEAQTQKTGAIPKATGKGAYIK
ncbi:nucleoprotein [Pectinophora gossypiella virus 2]|nr:nucleoprotein [Pectinophora gossypiella virus 2]